MSDPLTVVPPAEKTSYDEVPYQSHPFAQTHPNRLATVATLFGLRPPPVFKARILELGCAAGGNLIPVAEQFPETRCFGIDLSSRQINDGLQTVAELGLSNVELRHANILDVEEDYGRFDYIMCHGVFSWVSDGVREKIFDIIARLLNPNGVAYVSYNTYPGWHMREMVRDMMRYHTAKFSASKVRVQQARALLDFLASSVKQQGGPYEILLRQELEGLRKAADSYLYHEHLEEVNQPVYFHQFAERAAAKGLRYLGDARITTMMVDNYDPDVKKALRFLAADQIQAEQYLDFLRNRTFRESLLCHNNAAVVWTIQPESLRFLRVASGSVPVSDAKDLIGPEPVVFRSPSGVNLQTAEPLIKAAMLSLREVWPQSLPFLGLCQLARKQLGGSSSAKPGEEDARVLALGLLNGYLHSDLMELHACSLEFVTNLTERPTATPLSRLQARRSGQVTNRRHEVIWLHDLDRRVLCLLDGQHDRSAILNELVKAAADGKIVVDGDEGQVRDPERLQAILGPGLDQCLANFTRMALLIA